MRLKEFLEEATVTKSLKRDKALKTDTKAELVVVGSGHAFVVRGDKSRFEYFGSSDKNEATRAVVDINKEITKANWRKSSASINEEYKAPAPFTDVSKEDIIKIISKPRFTKTAGTIKKAVNPTTFKGYKLSGAAFYLAKGKTSRASFPHIDKDVTLLHAAVYFKSPVSKDKQYGGELGALLVTCHSQDGKTWVRDEIIQSNGYFTENPLDKDKSVEMLKCYAVSEYDDSKVSEVANTRKITNR